MRKHAGSLVAGAVCAVLLASVNAGAHGTQGPGDGAYRPVWSWQSATRQDTRRPPVPRGVREPAFTRGYSDGWEKGFDAGRDRERYDPVRHGAFRAADKGYTPEYGPKEAYRNNYRAGFRQGYEDGYRDGARRRR